MWICCGEYFELKVKKFCQWIAMCLKPKSTCCNSPSSSPSPSADDIKEEMNEIADLSINTRDKFIPKPGPQNRFKLNVGHLSKHPQYRFEARKRLKRAAIYKTRKLRRTDPYSKRIFSDTSEHEYLCRGDSSTQTVQPDNSTGVLYDNELLNKKDYGSSLTKHIHNQPCSVNSMNMVLGSNSLSKNSEAKEIYFPRENSNVMVNLCTIANVENLPENKNVIQNLRDNKNVIQNLRDNKNVIQNLRDNENVIENLLENANVIEDVRQNENLINDFRENTNIRINKWCKSNLPYTRYLTSYESMDEVVDIFDDIQCFVGKKDVVVLPPSSSACHTGNGAHVGMQPTKDICKPGSTDGSEQCDIDKQALNEEYKITEHDEALNFNSKEQLEDYRQVNIDKAASDLLGGDLSLILKSYFKNATSDNTKISAREIMKKHKTQTPEKWSETKHAKFPTLKVNIIVGNGESNSSITANISGNKSSQKYDFSNWQDSNGAEMCDNSTAVMITNTPSRKVHKENRFKSSTSSWSTSHAETWRAENMETYNSDKIILPKAFPLRTPIVDFNIINHSEESPIRTSDSRSVRKVRLLEPLNTRNINVAAKYNNGWTVSNCTACACNEPGFPFKKYQSRLGKQDKQNLSASHKCSLLDRANNQYICQNREQLKNTRTYSTTHGNETTQQIITDFFKYPNEASAENNVSNNTGRFSKQAMCGASHTEIFERPATQNMTCSCENGNYTCTWVEGDIHQTEWTTSYLSSVTSSSSYSYCSSADKIHKLCKHTTESRKTYNPAKTNDSRLTNAVNNYNKMAFIEHPHQQRFPQHKHGILERVDLLQKPHQVNWQKNKLENINSYRKDSHKYTHMHGRNESKINGLWCTNNVKQVVLPERASYSPIPLNKVHESMFQTNTLEDNKGNSSYERTYNLSSILKETKQDNEQSCTNRVSLQRDGIGPTCNVINRRLQHNKTNAPYDVGRSLNNHQTGPEIINKVYPGEEVKNSILEEKEQEEILTYKNRTSFQWNESISNGGKIKIQSDEAKKAYRSGCDKNINQVVCRQAHVGSEIKQYSQSMLNSQSPDNTYSCHSEQNRVSKPTKLDTKIESVNDVQKPTKVKMYNRQLNGQQSHIFEPEVVLSQTQLEPSRASLDPSRMSCIPLQVNTPSRANTITIHRKESRPSVLAEEQPSQPEERTISRDMPGMEETSSHCCKKRHFPSPDNIFPKDKSKALESEKLFRKYNRELVNNLENHNSKQKQCNQEKLIKNKRLSPLYQKNNAHINTIFVNSTIPRGKTHNARKLDLRYSHESQNPGLQFVKNKKCGNTGTVAMNPLLPPFNLKQNMYTISSDIRRCTSIDPSAQEQESLFFKDSCPNDAITNDAITNDAITNHGFSNAKNEASKYKVANNRKSIHIKKHTNEDEKNESNDYPNSCNDGDTATEDLNYVDSYKASSTSENITLLALTTLNHELMSSSPIIPDTPGVHSTNCTSWEATMDEQKVTPQPDMITTHRTSFSGGLRKAMPETYLESENDAQNRNATKQNHTKHKRVARNMASESEKVARADALVDKVISRKYESGHWSRNSDYNLFKKRSSGLSRGQVLQETTNKSSEFDCNKSSNTSDDMCVQSRKHTGTNFNAEGQGTDYARVCAMAPALIKCSRGEIMSESACCHRKEKMHVCLAAGDQLVNTDQTQRLLSKSDRHTHLKAENQRNTITAPITNIMYKKPTSSQLTNNWDAQNIKRFKVRKTGKQEESLSFLRMHNRPNFNTFNKENNRQTLVINRVENINKQSNVRANKTVKCETELYNGRERLTMLKSRNKAQRTVSPNPHRTVEDTKNNRRAKLGNVVDPKENKHSLNVSTESKQMQSRFSLDGNDIQRSKQSATTKSTFRSGCEEVHILNTERIFQKNSTSKRQNKIPRLVRQKYLQPAKPKVDQCSSLMTQLLFKAKGNINKCRNELRAIERKGLSHDVNLKQILAESNTIDPVDKKSGCNNIKTKTDLKKLTAPRDIKKNAIKHLGQVEACSDVDNHHMDVFPRDRKLRHESELLLTNISPIISSGLDPQRQQSYSKIPKKSSSPLCSQRSVSSTEFRKLNIPSKRCPSRSTDNQEGMTYNFAEVECPWETSCRRTKLVRIAQDENVASNIIRKPSKADKCENTKEKLCPAQLVNGKGMLTGDRHKQKHVPKSSNLYMSSNSKQLKLPATNNTLHSLIQKANGKEHTTFKSTSKSHENESGNTREVMECENCPYAFRKRDDKQRQEKKSRTPRSTPKDIKPEGSEDTDNINKDCIARNTKNITGKQRMMDRAGCNSFYVNGNRKLPVSSSSTVKNSANKSACAATSNSKQFRKHAMKHETRLLKSNKMACVRNTTKNNNEKTLVSSSGTEKRSNRSRSFYAMDSEESAHCSRKSYRFHEQLKSSRTPFSKMTIDQDNLLDNNSEDPKCKSVHERSSHFEFSIRNKLNCDWYKPLKSPNRQPIPPVRPQGRATADPRNVTNYLVGVDDFTEDSHETKQRGVRAVEAEFTGNKSHLVNYDYESDSSHAPQSPYDELLPRYSVNDTYSLISSDTSSVDRNTANINSKSQTLQVWSVNENSTKNNRSLGINKLRSKLRKPSVSVAKESIIPPTIDAPIKIPVTVPVTILRDRLSLNELESFSLNVNNISPDSSKILSTGSQNPSQHTAINEEAIGDTSGESPVINLNPKSTAGFSYLYANSSDWNCSEGNSSCRSQLTENHSLRIRVRRPIEGTFVEQLVKIFEKNLKQFMPATEGK